MQASKCGMGKKNYQKLLDSRIFQ